MKHAKFASKNYYFQSLFRKERIPLGIYMEKKITENKTDCFRRNEFLCFPTL